MKLVNQKKISNNLLYFPDDILLCVQEFNKQYLRQISDELKAETISFDVIGDKVIESGENNNED